jgi:hypothetical protein
MVSLLAREPIAKAPRVSQTGELGGFGTPVAAQLCQGVLRMRVQAFGLWNV